MDVVYRIHSKTSGALDRSHAAKLHSMNVSLYNVMGSSTFVVRFVFYYFAVANVLCACALSCYKVVTIHLTVNQHKFTWFIILLTPLALCTVYSATACGWHSCYGRVAWVLFMRMHGRQFQTNFCAELPSFNYAYLFGSAGANSLPPNKNVPSNRTICIRTHGICACETVTHTLGPLLRPYFLTWIPCEIRWPANIRPH